MQTSRAARWGLGFLLGAAARRSARCVRKSGPPPPPPPAAQSPAFSEMRRLFAACAISECFGHIFHCAALALLILSEGRATLPTGRLRMAALCFQTTAQRRHCARIFPPISSVQCPPTGPDVMNQKVMCVSLSQVAAVASPSPRLALPTSRRAAVALIAD